MLDPSIANHLTKEETRTFGIWPQAQSSPRPLVQSNFIKMRFLHRSAAAATGLDHTKCDGLREVVLLGRRATTRQRLVTRFPLCRLWTGRSFSDGRESLGSQVGQVDVAFYSEWQFRPARRGTDRRRSIPFGLLTTQMAKRKSCNSSAFARQRRAGPVPQRKFFDLENDLPSIPPSLIARSRHENYYSAHTRCIA